LRRQRRKIAAAELDVVALTFDDVEVARQYVRDMRWPWPLLVDSSQSVYGLYGMRRGNWWDMYGPVAILRYLALMFRGRFPGRPGRDWRQLGGDVLIDPSGIIRLYHASTNPHDRPPLRSILAIVEDNSRDTTRGNTK
jgi:hypothetical protein